MSKVKARIVKFKYRTGYQRLTSRESGTCGLKAGHVVLHPGQNIGRHTTAEREEIIIVLKGKGEVLIDNSGAVKIQGSSALYIPPHTGHDIKNIGRERLDYIFVTARSCLF